MRMSSKNGLLIVLVASVASLGSSACSIQNTPHAPTFESDIKEITLSRCVRCHGAGGTLNLDPDSINPKGAPFDGFFDRMEDDCPDGQAIDCHGLGHYVNDPRLHNFIHRLPGALPMPPTPAPMLTSDQLDVFDLWIANGGPAN